MATMPPSYGTSGAKPPLLPISSSGIPIIFEWVALLPLVIYLASSRLSYQLVGQTALSGFISVGLFPRLGVLNSIADFLTEGSDFLDRASSVSELRRTVWDANWGSVFPCANGAASDIVSKYALRGANLIEIPEDVPVAPPPTNLAQTAQTAQTAILPVQNPNFRRYQMLHIFECSQPGVGPLDPVPHWSHLGSTSQDIAFELVPITLLLGLFTVTILFGMYGTSTAILIMVFFRIARQLIRPIRPEGYLVNNEPGATGCMLVALHENASTWYLYTGSRGVIDALLNKPMIKEITSPLSGTRLLGLMLRGLGYLQLIAMTYVAAQKGWDGVGLLALVVVAGIFDVVIYGDGNMAALWLNRSGVAITAKSFCFSGRTAMLGAIQKLKGTDNNSWMDSILPQSDRRDVWLARLAGEGLMKDLSAEDMNWVDRNESLTLRAVETIRAHMPSSPVLKWLHKEHKRWQLPNGEILVE